LSRVLAIDYGAKRTGLAVTDELQLIASGLTTIATDRLMEFLTDYLKKESVSVIVVGKPNQMDGTESQSEVLIKPFLINLKKKFPGIDIERIDERFTSKIAAQSLIETGVKKKRRRNKELLDEISATLILQSYLDRPVR
jgi:putative Holliday junction resolvase